MSSLSSATVARQQGFQRPRCIDEHWHYVRPPALLSRPKHAESHHEITHLRSEYKAPMTEHVKSRSRRKHDPLMSELIKSRSDHVTLRSRHTRDAPHHEHSPPRYENATLQPERKDTVSHPRHVASRSLSRCQGFYSCSSVGIPAFWKSTLPVVFLWVVCIPLLTNAKPVGANFTASSTTSAAPTDAIPSTIPFSGPGAPDSLPSEGEGLPKVASTFFIMVCLFLISIGVSAFLKYYLLRRDRPPCCCERPSKSTVTPEAEGLKDGESRQNTPENNNRAGLYANIFAMSHDSDEEEIRQLEMEAKHAAEREDAAPIRGPKRLLATHTSILRALETADQKLKRASQKAKQPVIDLKESGSEDIVREMASIWKKLTFGGNPNNDQPGSIPGMVVDPDSKMLTDGPVPRPTHHSDNHMSINTSATVHRNPSPSLHSRAPSILVQEANDNDKHSAVIDMDDGLVGDTPRTTTSSLSEDDQEIGRLFRAQSAGGKMGDIDGYSADFETLSVCSGLSTATELRTKSDGEGSERNHSSNQKRRRKTLSSHRMRSPEQKHAAGDVERRPADGATLDNQGTDDENILRQPSTLDDDKSDKRDEAVDVAIEIVTLAEKQDVGPRHSERIPERDENAHTSDQDSSGSANERTAFSKELLQSNDGNVRDGDANNNGCGANNESSDATSGRRESTTADVYAKYASKAVLPNMQIKKSPDSRTNRKSDTNPQREHPESKEATIEEKDEAGDNKLEQGNNNGAAGTNQNGNSETKTQNETNPRPKTSKMYRPNPRASRPTTSKNGKIKR